MNIKNMPKVELHLHLDGSLKPSRVAKMLNISLNEAQEKLIAPDKCRDLNEYLTRFNLPIELMQTKDNLEIISKDLGEDLLAENVIYAEIRFAPAQHKNKDLSYDDIILSIKKGLDSVHELKYGLILCLMRHHDIKTNKEIIDLAKKYLQNGVVAIDLAGAEGIYPTKDFKDLFLYAKSAGVPFTIHAGEADGPNSILSAIDFGTTRIGHGVRSTESKEVMELLKNKNITLEVCPSSNVQTNIFPSIEEHNVKYLYDNNIKVTISTDNRTVSNTTITNELELLRDKLFFSEEDLYNLQINAVEAAFINKEEKEKLKNIIQNKII